MFWVCRIILLSCFGGVGYRKYTNAFRLQKGTVQIRKAKIVFFRADSSKEEVILVVFNCIFDHKFPMESEKFHKIAPKEPPNSMLKALPFFSHSHTQKIFNILFLEKHLDTLGNSFLLCFLSSVI
jgi:hypothetical protein